MSMAELEEISERMRQQRRRRQQNYNGGIDPEDYGGEHEPTPLKPLRYTDLLAALVLREWLIYERIPMFNVTLLSGEGAIGKSIALLQLAAAVVLGRWWFFDADVTAGPVLYIAAEEDEDEIRRRLEAIATHGIFNSSRKELIEKGLRVLCFAGENALLAAPDRYDLIQPTPLFHQIKADAIALRPKLIIIDPVADVFGGKENDRGQTRMFVTLMRGLALAARSAVILSSHPSRRWCRQRQRLERLDRVAQFGARENVFQSFQRQQRQKHTHP